MHDTQHKVEHIIFPGAEAVIFASFGVGIGQIWLDNVACTGNESRLIDCPANPPGLHNCYHVEDAGVRCLHQVSISKSIHLFYNLLNMHVSL